jgi:molybdate transport system substrate-binding protein
MKRFLWSVALAVYLTGAASAPAQTVTPARPVDPNQPLPAQPVETPSPVPPPPIPAPPSSTTNADAAPAAPVALTIVAESSLKQVLQELTQNWADSQDNGPQVALTLTNSGTLRSKVEGNSVWDVVISADVQDVKEMTDKGALLAAGQRSLARNTLVIYGRKALIKDDQLDWFDLIGTEWKKVALGNADLTASGRVAQHALQKHGLLDDDHKQDFAYAETESRALAVAESEQADAVFVYKSDLAGVSLPGFDVFPLTTEDAPPIFYTASVSRQSKNPAQAHAFIDYCGSEAARAVWAKYGFETN